MGTASDEDRIDERMPARLLRGITAGFVAGALASFAMDRFQAVLSDLEKRSADGTPATVKAADAVAGLVAGRSVPKADEALAGQIVHYALGTGLGIAYGVAVEFVPKLAIGRGAAFGVGIAALLDESAVPAVGLGTPPWRTSALTHAYTLASHVVFGTAAEFARSQVRRTLVD